MRLRIIGAAMTFFGCMWLFVGLLFAADFTDVLRQFGSGLALAGAGGVMQGLGRYIEESRS